MRWGVVAPAHCVSGVGERVEEGDKRRGDKVAPTVDNLGLDEASFQQCVEFVLSDA